MAGGFSKTARAVLPGAYFNFEAAATLTTPPSLGGIAVVFGTHTYGPENVAVACDSFVEFQAIYGKGDSDLRRAVYSAFNGRGLPGKGGASRVIVYRQVGAAGVTASIVLKNTANADALRLTARYKGTGPNSTTFTLQHGASPSNDELQVIRGGRVVESFVSPNTGSTQLAAFAAQINATSAFWTAAVIADGTSLALVTAVPPTTPGNDGTTIAGSDLTAMLSGLEYESFSVLAPANLTDSSAHALIVGWVQDTRKRGKRMTVVLGGPLDESFNDHRVRTLTYNDPDIVSFGVGRIDDVTLDLTGQGVVTTISTAQGAARVAGDIAARGNRKDLINSRYLGWTVRNGVSLAQAELAAKNGMCVLTRDGHPTAPTRINEGVTSYTSSTDLKPNRIYSRVKFVRTMQLLELDITHSQEYGDFIGELGVTDKARDLVIGGIREELDDLVAAEVILPGYTLGIDDDPPPTDDDDFIQVKYGIHFVRGLRAIYNTVSVS